MMGTYSSDEYLDTFGGLPEPGETYPADPDTVRDAGHGREARGDLVLVRHLPAVLGQVLAIYRRRDGSYIVVSTIPMAGKWQEETMAFACDEAGGRLGDDGDLAADRYAGSRARVLEQLGGVRDV